jgi:hypothetical protein
MRLQTEFLSDFPWSWDPLQYLATGTNAYGGLLPLRETFVSFGPGNNLLCRSVSLFSLFSIDAFFLCSVKYTSRKDFGALS